MKPLLVALAGAAGALARYGIGTTLGVRSFPWATLGINVAGSFVLGVVLGSQRWSPTATTAIAIGFLGAFTTFSTFAFEGTALLRDDRPVAAATYVALSVGLGLAAAGLGWAAGRAAA